MTDREKLVKELEFCLGLWEKQGHCGFGGETRCQECAAPYLIYKLITGKALHSLEGEERMERLSLEGWKGLLEEAKYPAEKRIQFRKGKGQPGCRFARVEKDRTVWCTKNEWVCGITEGAKCPDFQPTLSHFGGD